MQIVDHEHYLQFGRIVHHYATVETGIKITLCGLLQIDLGDMLILSEPYSSATLRNVAKAMSEEKLTEEWRDQLNRIIDDFAKFGPIRNLIAHSRWTTGERLGSIKPRRVDIRSGKAKWLGDAEVERSWTALDLAGVATELHALNERLKGFQEDSGLKAIIQQNLLGTGAPQEE